jgi:hypothetical protein
MKLVGEHLVEESFMIALVSSLRRVFINNPHYPIANTRFINDRPSSFRKSGPVFFALSELVTGRPSDTGRCAASTGRD